MPERLTSWVNENWPWMMALASVFGVGVRNEYKTTKLDRAVFDEHGDMRLQRVMNCNACRVECQEHLRREIEDMKNQTREDMHEIKKSLGMLIGYHMRRDE